MLEIKFSKNKKIKSKPKLKYFKTKKRFTIPVKRKNFKFLKKLRVILFQTKITKAVNSVKGITQKITLQFSQNNIFCSLYNIEEAKTIHVASSGIYKIKISKRKLKHFYNKFLINFFKIIKKNTSNLSNTYFKIITPRQLRKKICKLVMQQLKTAKSRNFFIDIKPKKCFNGCRAKKKVRKKDDYIEFINKFKLRW